MRRNGGLPNRGRQLRSPANASFDSLPSATSAKTRSKSPKMKNLDLVEALRQELESGCSLSSHHSKDIAGDNVEVLATSLGDAVLVVTEQALRDPKKKYTKRTSKRMKGSSSSSSDDVTSDDGRISSLSDDDDEDNFLIGKISMAEQSHWLELPQLRLSDGCTILRILQDSFSFFEPKVFFSSSMILQY